MGDSHSTSCSLYSPHGRELPPRKHQCDIAAYAARETDQRNDLSNSRTPADENHFTGKKHTAGEDTSTLPYLSKPMPPVIDPDSQADSQADSVDGANKRSTPQRETGLSGINQDSTLASTSLLPGESSSSPRKRNDTQESTDILPAATNSIVRKNSGSEKSFPSSTTNPPGRSHGEDLTAQQDVSFRESSVRSLLKASKSENKSPKEQNPNAKNYFGTWRVPESLPLSNIDRRPDDRKLKRSLERRMRNITQLWSWSRASRFSERSSPPCAICRRSCCTDISTGEGQLHAILAIPPVDKYSERRGAFYFKSVPQARCVLYARSNIKPIAKLKQRKEVWQLHGPQGCEDSTSLFPMRFPTLSQQSGWETCRKTVRLSSLYIAFLVTANRKFLDSSRAGVIL